VIEVRKSYEVNFDGLVGPTHNYSGLSFGNVASEVNKGDVSRPREAALQGLRKMRFLHDLGLKQAVLPPLPRPFLPLMRQLGYRSLAEVSPELLPSLYSASSMWVANAATISPSSDTVDGKVHITTANLVTHLHRSLEAPYTARVLSKIFADSKHFIHHAPLPMHPRFGDEGAANYMRFAAAHGAEGLEVLVYGQKTNVYPARQTKEASSAIFRLHGVKKSLLIEQNPAAIDAGVFHNDVIAVANENALLYHEEAFVNTETALYEIESHFGQKITRLCVKSSEVTVEEAVKSYLFNSQLLTLPDGSMAVIAPTESEDNPRVRAALMRFQQAEDNPVSAIHFLNLRESMKNGGGPACLRLRVVLNEDELAAMHQGVIFTPALQEKLEAWVNKHYRETLAPSELADLKLAQESLAAQRELLTILDMEGIYPEEILTWN
jgi:succinylarginine dihydrolase